MDQPDADDEDVIQDEVEEGQSDEDEHKGMSAHKRGK
jgi:hypothetical protein